MCLFEFIYFVSLFPLSYLNFSLWERDHIHLAHCGAPSAWKGAWHQTETHSRFAFRGSSWHHTSSVTHITSQVGGDPSGRGDREMVTDQRAGRMWEAANPIQKPCHEAAPCPLP